MKSLLIRLVLCICTSLLPLRLEREFQFHDRAESFCHLDSGQTSRLVVGELTQINVLMFEILA